jgi:aminodeoxyfutalosine deaminase
MIYRARTVVTMDGPPIWNGAVAISGNRIIDVGEFSEIASRHSVQKVLDLGDSVLLPGLINAHCHLDYTCLRGKIPPQKSFADWIRAINAEKAKLAANDYLRSIAEGFAEAKRFGTTTVANLTAFPELISQIHSPLRTWWFAELIDVRSPERANELVDLAVESLGRARPLATAEPVHGGGGPGVPWGLAPHALFTASRTLYRRCEEIARSENILLTTHLAESREEMSMFRDGSGPLYNFMESIGRPMDDCGNATPLERFLGASSPWRAGSGRTLPGRWIIAHLNELTESDFKLLERATRKFHVVHSPRSHSYFAHSRFPFEKLRALGFNICLGNDSLASNESLSLFAEMRAFQHNKPCLSPEKILEMVTVNPAQALHQQETLGRIRPGFQADLISIPSAGSANLFEEIVAFDGSIDWMMAHGSI